MARNDEIKKTREITVCGFPSIYSKYFFQTNTKIFYKSLKSFITCFWPEITYWRFMTCSIPQCKFFLSKITYWRFIICSISQCMNSWSIICELNESTRYLLIQKFSSVEPWLLLHNFHGSFIGQPVCSLIPIHSSMTRDMFLSDEENS